MGIEATFTLLTKVFNQPAQFFISALYAGLHAGRLRGSVPSAVASLYRLRIPDCGSLPTSAALSPQSQLACPDKQSIVAREEDFSLRLGPEGLGAPGADLVELLALADGVGDVGFGEHVVDVEFASER